MEQYRAPGEVSVAADDNAVAALIANAASRPDSKALAYRRGDEFVDLTLAEVREQIDELAAGLVGLGLEPGDRVCLFSSTRLEFTLLDYAIWSAGLVTVPIYETSSTDQVEWIVHDSGARAIVCENEQLRACFDEIDGARCEHVFVIEDGGLSGVRRAAGPADADEAQRRTAAISHDDDATIVYTSGTTGQPKGCVLTHGNIIWEVRQAVAAEPAVFHEESSTLMFLPLAHILARAVQIACLTAGTQVGYSTGIPQLAEELKLFRPTLMFSVPRVFEKIFNGAQQRAGTGLKRTLFDRAVAAAVEWSRAIDEPAGPSALLRARHTFYDRLVYAKLREAFGGRLEYAISGGAPLGERLAHFFRGVGVVVFEGFGLTECSAAATVNTPDFLEIGSVGRPLPGSEVRIGNDGEVLVRGPHVFSGYWQNEAATGEAIDSDGWLHTGDIGELNDQAFLRITGRKKDLIVTSSGKNMAPAVLEDQLRAHPLISQVLVVGDAKPFIAALITLDEEALEHWKSDNGRAVASLDELAEDPSLRAEIQRAVDEANRAVSRAESIREFRILPSDFTIEGGELTPTLKVKRNVVLTTRSEVITDIYG